MARPTLDASVVFRVTRADRLQLKRWARERRVDMADIFRGWLEQERARVAAQAPAPPQTDVTEQAA